MGDRSSQFLSSGWQEALAFMFNGSTGSSMSGDGLWSQTVLGLNPLLLCSVIVAQVAYFSGSLYASHIPDLLCTYYNIWFVTTFMPGNLGSSETPTLYFSPFTGSNYLLVFDCLSWDCQHHKKLGQMFCPAGQLNSTEKDNWRQDWTQIHSFLVVSSVWQILKCISLVITLMALNNHQLFHPASSPWDWRLWKVVLVPTTLVITAQLVTSRKKPNP